MHYVISLGLTLALELLTAWCWHIRRRDLLLVALANALTNPVVVLVHQQCGGSLWLGTVVPELAAVAVEAGIYLRLENRIARPVLFAVLANILSYSAGAALQICFGT